MLNFKYSLGVPASMNLNFVLNDYVLIWNLLFRASISSSIQDFKQKLWKNYRHSYNDLYKEEEYILKDPKNYIPDDDAIFDMVKASEIYQEIRNETEKYRLELLHTWDTLKKDLSKELKNIIRFDIKLYHVLVVDKKLDIIGMSIPKSKRVNTITWGNRSDSNDYTLAIINIIEHILRKELVNYQVEYKDIVDAIIELAIDNELTSRVLKKSVYLRGDNSLKYLKKQLYPYFLMYLGYSKEEILNRMMEDKIIFELDKYTYERGLATVDLKTFIDFCIKNQKYILKISELEII